MGEGVAVLRWNEEGMATGPSVPELPPTVGQVGKPRACHDCKRRRVKCDYRQPTCARCERATIDCKGYQRSARFVNRSPRNPSGTPPPLPSLNLQVRGSVDAHLQLLQAQIQKPTGLGKPCRLQAWEILKKLYLPQPSQGDIRKSSIFSWLPIVCELEGSSRALDYSLHAFCVIQVAVTKTGSACVAEALQVYNDALQQLQVEITDDGAGQSDEILATISVLSTCELFVCPSNHSWRVHAQGLSKILRIRSGVDPPTPTWQSFCSRIRIVLLIEALVKSRARLGTISQCRELKSTSNEHDAFHKLVDTACEVPILLEESDTLIARSEIMPEEQKAELFRASLAVLEKLYDRHQKYKLEKEKPLYCVAPTKLLNPADEPYKNKLFPFALQFDSLETASLVVFWGAIVLQVLCSMIDLHQHFYNSILTSASSMPDHLAAREPILNSRFPTVPSIKDEADKLARYLCQSFEYCHRIENGTIGPQMTCYAQWILKSYFERFHYERELAWCLNIKNMKGPGFSTGIELMEFHD